MPAIIYRFMLMLILMSFSALSYADEETFDTFSHRISSWAGGLSGVVVSAGSSGYTIDLGKESSIVKGMRFNVTRAGEELIHPVTGKSLGVKAINLGQLEVTGVQPEYSSADALKGVKFVKGDKVSITLPVPIRLSLSNLSEDEKLDARFAVLNSGKFVESDKGDYTVSCVKSKPEEGIVTCGLYFKGGLKITESKIPVTAIIVTTASTTVKIDNNKKNLSGASVFDKKFNSVAAGFIMGQKDGVTAAAAESKVITVYKYSGNTFKETASIKPAGVAEIINIEIADINNNGIDEIFVSNMLSEGKVSSSIYEYDGGEFKLLESGIKFLFRSYFMNGQKVITAQQFESGDFTGAIYPYIYEDGVYLPGDAFADSFGLRLYGFASGRITGRAEMETVSFNTTGNLVISNSKNEKIIIDNHFGDTPHKILYTREIITGVEKDEEGMDQNIINSRIVGLPVYQRIIEVNLGKFMLTSNEPVLRKAIGDDRYRRSTAGLYMFINKSLETLNIIETGMPAIVESDIVNDNGLLKIIILKNNNAGLFGTNNSTLKFIDITIR